MDANRSRNRLAPTITSPVTMPRYSRTGRPSTIMVVVLNMIMKLPQIRPGWPVEAPSLLFKSSEQDGPSKERKGVVEGKGVSGLVDRGGRSFIKKINR